MSALADLELPHGVSFEWGGTEDARTVESVSFHDIIFEVNHQLPADIETAAILRAAGVRIASITEFVGKQATYLVDKACEAHNMPRTERYYYSRTPMLIGRLCLPRGILESKTTTPTLPEPDNTAKRIVTLLGEGRNWVAIEKLMGWERRHAIAHLRNYYGEVAGERFSINPILLHAYGSHILNPESVVAGQPFPKPQLPLQYTAPKMGRITRMERWERERKRKAQEIDIPNQFQPFEDTYKLISGTRATGEYKFSHIQAGWALLEVNDTDVITNWDGEEISLTPREKLTLLLIALGATTQEIHAHGMKVKPLAEFRRKIGVGSGMYGLTEATLLTCRELVSPINPPGWYGRTPDFSWVSEYIKEQNNRVGRSRTAEDIRKEISIISKGFTRGDNPPAYNVNLMILLGYADDLIPESALYKNSGN